MSRLVSERLWRRRRNFDPALAACSRLALRGTTAIDVGAESGLYSLAMRRAVGRHGHVVSLEPNPTSFEELARRTWASGIDRRQVAASATAGQATLHIPAGSMKNRDLAGLGSLASELHEASSHGRNTTHSVETMTLDSLLDETLPPVSLVKIDVEGWELEVIEGAERFLRFHRPVLVVEIESRHLRPRGIDPTNLVESILSLGYSVDALGPQGLISWSDFSFEQHQHLTIDSPRTSNVFVHNFLFSPLDA